MTANYHTHTTRCQHAVGTEKEYVEEAIKGGLKVLGFSDHVPYPFPSGYISHIRMRVDETKDYVSVTEKLREEYKNQITILTGYETEYFPKYFDACMENLNTFGYDYMILSQHHVEDEVNGVYTGNRTSEKRVLHRYAELLIKGMETGLFAYIGHPDLIDFVGDKDEYYAVMKEICTAAKELSLPLEYNIEGKRLQRNYPNDTFFEIAAEVGNPIIIGIDAHRPQSLSDRKAVEAAEQYLKEREFEIVENIRLQR